MVFYGRILLFEIVGYADVPTSAQGFFRRRDNVVEEALGTGRDSVLGNFEHINSGIHTKLQDGKILMFCTYYRLAKEAFYDIFRFSFS